MLEVSDTLRDCAERCQESDECQYFHFGKTFRNEWECHWETTTSADCPEGFEMPSGNYYDDWNFYKMKKSKLN